MSIKSWDERYREQEGRWPPNPLVVETARGLKPGRALDLACGTGRNALWLAENGWRVTAVDGSAVAIGKLRELAGSLPIETHVADLERHEFAIAEAAFDLIVMCFYLQRDLFESIQRGVKPGGTAVVIVHIAEEGEPANGHRLLPGELARYFADWEILYNFEGVPHDPAHRRASAELVARNSY